MKLFKSVDERLSDLGFTKIGDNDYGVHYEREIKEYNYIQIISINHKASGKHIMLSYQKDVNTNGYNNAVGLTYLETKLFLKKMKQKGWLSK